MNFYNDIDKNAAAWTQQLITNKLIPDGVMLCKSITDIQPHELDGFTQAHFFNGISGWARALDLAGWPATRPIWCASLPCQPFSCAGKGEGVNDERHLWPVFFQLVKACTPVVIVGEQVAAAIGHGWLDGVFADLEGEGYTCGAVIVGAHSVKSPHRRQRIYWVARRVEDTNSGLRRTSDATGADSGSTAPDAYSGSGETGSMGHPDGAGCPAHGTVPIGTEQGTLQSPVAGASDGSMAHTQHGRCEQRDTGIRTVPEPDKDGRTRDTLREGLEAERTVETGSCPGLLEEFWGNTWHHCRDNKWRRIPATADVERVFLGMAPGLQSTVDDIGLASLGFPLSKTIPNRVALLKGYGNAIVPQVAAEFLKTVMDILDNKSAT